MLLNYNNSCDKNRTASFLCPHTWLFSVYIRLSKQKAEKQNIKEIRLTLKLCCKSAKIAQIKWIQISLQPWNLKSILEAKLGEIWIGGKRPKLSYFSNLGKNYVLCRGKSELWKNLTCWHLLHMLMIKILNKIPVHFQEPQFLIFKNMIHDF